MGKNFVKLSVDDIGTDASYQRVLDEGRVNTMAKNFDEARIGVPVLSLRKDGAYVVLDGQHRVAAIRQAGIVGLKVLCEVHNGLTHADEAAMFLKLNNGRKSVQVFDKYRAQLVAKEPMAVEFTSIVHSLGLRIGQAPGKHTICAIKSIEFAHKRNRNLEPTLSILKRWGKGDAAVFDGTLIKNISEFLIDHPEAKPDELLSKIDKHDPSYVMRRIRAMCDVLGNNRRLAAGHVFRDFYNQRRKESDRLHPVAARGTA